MKAHLKQIYEHIAEYPEFWEYRIDLPEYFLWFTKKYDVKLMPVHVFDIFSGDLLQDLKKEFVSATISQKPEAYGHFNHFFTLNNKEVLVLALRSDDNRVWYDAFLWGTNMAQGGKFCEKYKKHNITDIVIPDKKFGFGDPS